MKQLPKADFLMLSDLKTELRTGFDWEEDSSGMSEDGLMEFIFKNQELLEWDCDKSEWSIFQALHEYSKSLGRDPHEDWGSNE